MKVRFLVAHFSASFYANHYSSVVIIISGTTVKVNIEIAPNPYMYLIATEDSTFNPTLLRIGKFLRNRIIDMRMRI